MSRWPRHGLVRARQDNWTSFPHSSKASCSISSGLKVPKTFPYSILTWLKWSIHDHTSPKSTGEQYMPKHYLTKVLVNDTSAKESNTMCMHEFSRKILQNNNNNNKNPWRNSRELVQIKVQGTGSVSRGRSRNSAAQTPLPHFLQDNKLRPHGDFS